MIENHDKGVIRDSNELFAKSTPRVRSTDIEILNRKEKLLEFIKENSPIKQSDLYPFFRNQYNSKSFESFKITITSYIVQLVEIGCLERNSIYTEDNIFTNNSILKFVKEME